MVDACVSWEKAPYSKVAMRRVILWTDSYFWDVFHVEAPRECQMDWVCRFQGDRRRHAGLSDRGVIALSGDGYNHIRQPVEFVPREMVSFQWGLPMGGVGAFLLEGAGAQIIVGEAPLQPATETGDVLIRRRIARKTTFVALVHHWGTDPEVSRVDAVGSGGPGGARWIQGAGGDRTTSLGHVGRCFGSLGRRG